MSLKLFEPIQVGNITLKNRIAMSPMGTSADPDGGYGNKAIRYYEERAKGGYGLIIAGINQVTERYETRARNLLENHFHGERLNILCDKIHAYDARLFLQISPGLGRMVWAPPDSPPYSASECETYWYKGVFCKEYAKSDIEFLVEKMVKGAKIAQDMGVDGINLHAYGGYLFDQFMSTQWNRRTDEYGGDLRGRMKFILDTIQGIRQVCGKDLCIDVKYTPEHGVPGGRPIEEGVEMAKIFEEAGVTSLNVDMGNYDAWYISIPTTYQEPGYKFKAAKAVKDAVNIPVITCGKLTNPMIAEKGLEDGFCDIVEQAHQSLADPFWPQKVQEGRIHDIRWCIGCNECLYADFLHREKTCAINPRCYHEDEYRIPKMKGEPKVLVVGGGAAGMYAAYNAANSGCKVDLWEKSDKLGGMLNAAGAPRIKEDVARFMHHLEVQTYKTGVNVQLLKDASPEEIIRGNYDKVIVATGSKDLVPPIPGIDGPNVFTSLNALEAKGKLGDEVVIIGGGAVGIEAALHFSESAKKVTVVEMLDDIMKTAAHNRNVDMWLRHAIARTENIEIICGAKVTGIEDDKVTYTLVDGDDKTFSVPRDAVVVAVGFRSENKLADELRGKVKGLRVIGDANKPRKVITAIHEAHHAIRTMQEGEY